MLKKAIIIGLISLIVLTIVFFSYKYLSRHTNETSDLVELIPINTPVFIETKDFPDFIHKLRNNNYWKDLQKIGYFKRLNRQINYIDSVLLKNQEISEILKSTPFVASINLAGKSGFDFVFYVSLNQTMDSEKIKDIIQTRVGSKATISERSYNNRILYDVKLSSDKYFKSFSFSVSDQVFILSFSSLLVEDAIRQQDSDISIKKKMDFKKVAGTAGKNVEANLYINHQTFNELASIFISKEYKKYIQSFNKYANWSELDVNLKDDYVLLNGFSITDDSTQQYLSVLLNQNPVRFRMDGVLPANTSTILGLGLSNFKQYIEDRIKYLKDIGKFSNYNKRINEILKLTDIKASELFEKIFEDEVALVYTDINSLDIQQNSYIVMKTKSSSVAESEMKKFLESYAAEKNITYKTLTGTIKMDSETSFDYYKNPFPELPALVFGDVFNNFNAHYFSFIDNYMVFSYSEKGLKSFLYANVLNKTLNNDITFNGFKDYLSEKYNFYFYTNPGISHPFIRTFFDKHYKTELDSNMDVIRKFQSFAVQLVPNNGMIYNNILLKYYPVVKEKPRTVWESKLDTMTNMKPKFVINYQTGEKEIFIQDIKNNIYLINNSGRILWKLHIDGPILSDIYQVDFYKNKKLQLLFSSKNKMYIIDRLGNNVENYPLDFRAPATNGIALFDYDKNREYRMMIACNDHHVYAYDIEGKLIKGWEFDISDKFVYKSLQHFQYENKDYIIFKDSLKTYIVDRKGTNRVEVKDFFPASMNNIFYFDKPAGKKDPCFITTDNKGTVFYINLDGNVTQKEFGEYSAEHFFELHDFDGDGVADYIFTDKNKIQVYNKKGDLIFDEMFESNISYQPDLYMFTNNNIKLGCVLKEKNKLFLFNNDGDIYDGFPLKGYTPFSIGHISNSNSIFNLFVGSQDGFLYNYEVH